MPDFFENEHDLEFGPNGPTPWFRVLITGSRAWPKDGRQPILVALADLRREHGRVTVVHGDCPNQEDRPGTVSVDATARAWCERVMHADMKLARATVRHEAYPALWREFGKQAGPIRNKYMVDLGADLCLGFPTAESRGTISCMDLATAAGIETRNCGVAVPQYPSVWRP